MNHPPTSLDEQLAALPRSIEPPQDLWPQIEAAIRPGRRSRSPWPLALAASVVIAAVSVMVTWKLVRAPAVPPLASNTAAPTQPATAVSFALPQQAAYLAARAELGRIWTRLMGKHYPAMSMIFVADLLDSPGKIELEATAVIPELPEGGKP